MNRRRLTKRPRWFGFEVLEVRRLLAGLPGTNPILENLTPGDPLTIPGIIDTPTNVDPSHTMPDLVDIYQVHLSIGQQLKADVMVPSPGPPSFNGLQSYLRVFDNALVPNE